MKIDKQVNNIAYNDEKHVYWNIKTSDIYTSVTKFIKLFEHSFNEDYFSKYKAIELCDFDNFKKIKKQYGFSKVVDVYEIENKFSEKYINAQTQILTEWKDKNSKSILKGLKLHKEKEQEILNQKFFLFENKKYNLAELFIEKNNKNSVYPELLIYDHHFKIAGQCDLILKDSDNNITIIDYKTNEKIETKNPFQKMKEPINHLEQCNFNTYCLQLSFYGYMLERKGFNIKDLYIMHIPDLKEETIIPCSYKKQELAHMLEFSDVFGGCFF